MNSIVDYWNNFQVNGILEHQNAEYKNADCPQSYYFCDNQKDADECAELVVNKIKCATSTSVWWFNKNQEPFPKVGDLAIVTNWNRQPKAIIRTTKVEIVKFKDITAEYAYIEGEGDKSLEYWKKVHLDYYTNEMKAFGEYPTNDLEIVCECFERIW